MSDILVDTQSTPATPAAGQSVLFVDTTSKLLTLKDDTGFTRSIGQTNFSTVAQVVPAAARTYIAGSLLAVPTGKLQIGTCFRWRLSMTKTAAGVAASTFDIAVGLAGSVADTARVSFIKAAGTAVVDEAWIDISCICRGPLSASGVLVGIFNLAHNLAATGHSVLPSLVVTTVSGAFDITPAGLMVGLCLTSGAADAITIQVVQAEAWNL